MSQKTDAVQTARFEFPRRTSKWSFTAQAQTSFISLCHDISMISGAPPSVSFSSCHDGQRATTNGDFTMKRCQPHMAEHHWHSHSQKKTCFHHLMQTRYWRDYTLNGLSPEGLIGGDVGVDLAAVASDVTGRCGAGRSGGVVSAAAAMPRQCTGQQRKLKTRAMTAPTLQGLGAWLSSRFLVHLRLLWP